jgi:4-hydroxymandelate oxidase
VCLADYEILARDRTPRMAYEYVYGGAGNETTMRWNREAYDRIKLRPRILVDVSKLDTRVTLFGQELAFPILLAPTAFHRMVHPEGELGTAKGASAANAAMVVSSASTTSIEEIAAVATKPLFFQLYVQRDRPFKCGLQGAVRHSGCADQRRSRSRSEGEIRTAAGDGARESARS